MPQLNIKDAIKQIDEAVYFVFKFNSEIFMTHRKTNDANAKLAKMVYVYVLSRKNFAVKDIKEVFAISDTQSTYLRLRCQDTIDRKDKGSGKLIIAIDRAMNNIERAELL